MRNPWALLWLLSFCCLGTVLSAGEEDLFQDPLLVTSPTPQPTPSAGASTPGPATGTAGSTGSTVLEDIEAEKGMRLTGSLSAVLGYSGGWDDFSLTEGSAGSAWSNLAVAQFGTVFRSDIRVNPSLRAVMGLSTEYPAFELKVIEAFIDYNLNKALYVRVGRQNFVQGVSRVFPFVNLTARVPDGTLSDNESFMARITLPVMAGGISALAYVREGLCADFENPAVEEILYGASWNLAMSGIDVTAGAYYHRELGLDFFYTGNLTLLGAVDVYSEGLFELAEYRLREFSLNTGFLVQFFSGNLTLNAEYFWNGETDDLAVLDRDVPLIYGPNVAAGFSASLFDKNLRLYMQLVFNIDERSGVLVPGMDVRLSPELVLRARLGYVLGEPSGPYGRLNPDPAKRDLLGALTLHLNASF